MMMHFVIMMLDICTKQDFCESRSSLVSCPGHSFFSSHTQIAMTSRRALRPIWPC